MNAVMRHSSDTALVDIPTMRETVTKLLGPADGPGALTPAAEGLDLLTALLRGHLELLIPEVAEKAGQLPKDSIPRYCAEVCIGEAQGKLRATPGPGPSGAVAYARRLARALKTLCDHYEELGSEHR
ncbi:hypothetical protein GCM10010206_40560 [Streptomyces cinerochromogenes]|nr:hypothetical protein GCM10010206_40560 [Streptomyces cinerochromogenes]